VVPVIVKVVEAPIGDTSVADTLILIRRWQAGHDVGEHDSDAFRLTPPPLPQT
jgi:hypothetical protein